MTASRFKRHCRISSPYNANPRRRFSSESETPQQSSSAEDGQEEEEESRSIYADSENVANTPRNEYYSPEQDSESLSIQETSPTQIPSVDSVDLLQPESSYVNIAPLPFFRGAPEECAITHLSRFHKVCRANNASSPDTMMRIFPATLEDEAALWYDLEIEPYPSLNWEEIKSSFLNVYRRTELIDEYRSQLVRLKQGENEPVRGFFLKMQLILRKWANHGIPEDVLKAIFIDGLREDFQDWIEPQMPETLHDALRLALAWEQAKNIRGTRNRKNVTGDFVQSKCGFCDGPHEESVCKIREMMRELWLRIKEKQRVSSLSQEPGKDCVNSTSVATSSHAGEGEGLMKDDGGGWSFRKRSQCQCYKHQCGKKTLERSNSVVSGISKGQ